MIATLELLAFGVGHWEIIVIVMVVVLLFGTSKIPSLMRNMGSGISEFKKGIREGEKDPGDQEKKPS